MKRGSFQHLPSQLEWAFAGLLGYATYVWSFTFGISKFLTLVLGAVVLNGWMSSKTADEVHYTDTMLGLDTIIVATYFLMLREIQLHPIRPDVLFWYYSLALTMLYMLWDLCLLAYVKDQARRRRAIRNYIVVLCVLALIQLLPIIPSLRNQPSPSWFDIVAGMSWVAVLGIWQYDKSRASHDH